MINLSKIAQQTKDKALYIVGLGKSGLPVFDACQAAGIKTILWDDQEAARQAAQLKNAVLQAPSEVDYSRLYALCLSPGIPFTHPRPHESVILAQNAGVEVLGDIELFHRACPDMKTIGITGTNGKSTTTALISHVLKSQAIVSAVGGNIGEAVLTLPHLPPQSTYVLELSSYQLDLCTRFVPNIALFINISPDHLDRHGSMERYVAAKKKIFNTDNIPVIGIDDSWSQDVFATIQKMNHRSIPVSCLTAPQNGVHVDTNGMLYDRGAKVFSLAGFKRLKGVHNWQNAAMAYAALTAYGLNAAQIESGFGSFMGLAHRQMLVREINGVAYINDSKATNDQAAAMALKTYQPIYWIAGGKDKGGGYADCEKFYPHIRHAYLIGEAIDIIADSLKKHGIPYTLCGTMDKAVAAAHHDAQKERLPGATVLLSPACASFDQFRSFEHRGDVFTSLVQNLTAAKQHKVAT